MPIVTIQVTREGTTHGVSSVTAEEKAALIKGASKLLFEVLNKPEDTTFVIIEEVEMDNWASAVCRWPSFAGKSRPAEDSRFAASRSHGGSAIN